MESFGSFEESVKKMQKLSTHWVKILIINIYDIEFVSNNPTKKKNRQNI